MREGGAADVVVGEIPDADELSRILWTTRCAEHGLLGTFETRELAEELQERHLAEHGSQHST